MKILIVDDEIYAVEAIREMIDWQTLGIDEVLTAYSMRQAQKQLSEKSVDILLCDIEMPQGTGLELVSWTREQNMQLVTVFLTSHANFSYANQAIRLETFDYILKPADPEELTGVLAKAVGKAAENQSRINRLKQAEYWNDSFIQLCEEFVVRVADGRLMPERDAIMHEVNRLHLNPLEFDGRFYIALIQLRAETESEKEWGKGLTEYGLKNILAEIFYGGKPDNGELCPKTGKGFGRAYRYGLPLIPRLMERHYLVAVNAERVSWEQFLSLCGDCVLSCQQAMPMAVTIYPAEAVPVEKFGKVTEQLLANASDNILYDNTVYFPMDDETSAKNEREWEQLLGEQPDWEDLGELLDCAARNGVVTRRYLCHIYDLTCQYLRRQLPGGISGMNLTVEKARATGSLDGMKDWMGRVFAQLPKREMETPADTQNVISILRRYIREHISEELGRNELAALVYLNPDYLSHIFRERTGVSLIDYITTERMKKARELLVSTDLSIRDVALAVGYSNISYFSRQFKRSQGKTPLEFRKMGS